MLMHELNILEGRPNPLGATPREDGSVNFAVSSQYASAVTLCLFTNTEDRTEETHRILLTERTGDTWYGRIKDIPKGATYGYRVDGLWEPGAGHFFNHSKLLLDPYAKHIDGPSRFHPSMLSSTEDKKRCSKDSGSFAPRAFVPTVSHYDWEGDQYPELPLSESSFIELHVKGFTKLNKDVPADLRGTYTGLSSEPSIRYLKRLGITTVQLLPVHQHLDDGFLIEKNLVNYWGYNTLGFFAPEARYSAGNDPVAEFKDMVKAFHREGLEVILDVVYNHTCEGGTDGPTCLLRGFDNAPYYHTDPGEPGYYRDFTGCGNSVDVSHPRSLRLVLDSMRYWVEEMHVDGFRFDLAVELGRGREPFRRRAAFFKAVSQDPVLCRTKLIAEPWDLGPGGYQIGNFPNDWAELNGKFRDCIRRFWRGDPGVTGEFAARITGSEDLFAHNRRKPEASINLITSHDGFTLHDLVSHNHKHNLANGEKNRDGDSHNIAYNHGVEGKTDDPKIQRLRQRQIRNFLATTICSQGVPFLTAGDERLRTQDGNNNSYCQDNEISWIDWNETAEATELREFVQSLFELRRNSPLLRQNRFFTGKSPGKDIPPDVCWLRADGNVKEQVDWEMEKPGAFAMMLHDADKEESILFFFNARHEEKTFHFPTASTCDWQLLADTSNPKTGSSAPLKGETVKLEDRSMQIWKSTTTS